MNTYDVSNGAWSRSWRRTRGEERGRGERRERAEGGRAEREKLH
jgi:hypothetical protein